MSWEGPHTAQVLHMENAFWLEVFLSHSWTLYLRPTSCLILMHRIPEQSTKKVAQTPWAMGHSLIHLVYFPLLTQLQGRLHRLYISVTRWRCQSVLSQTPPSWKVILLESYSVGLCGRQNHASPKDVHIPISKTCDYVIICGKRELRWQMALRLPVRWPEIDFPGLSE